MRRISFMPEMRYRHAVGTRNELWKTAGKRPEKMHIRRYETDTTQGRARPAGTDTPPNGREQTAGQRRTLGEDSADNERNR